MPDDTCRCCSGPLPRGVTLRAKKDHGMICDPCRRAQQRAYYATRGHRVYDDHKTRPIEQLIAASTPEGPARAAKLAHIQKKYQEAHGEAYSEPWLDQP